MHLRQYFRLGSIVRYIGIHIKVCPMEHMMHPQDTQLIHLTRLTIQSPQRLQSRLGPRCFFAPLISPTNVNGLVLNQTVDLLSCPTYSFARFLDQSLTVDQTTWMHSHSFHNVDAWNT